MMSAVICRRACMLLKASRSQLTHAAAFSTASRLPSRDRFYINDEPANISLPDSYSHQIQGLQGREHEFKTGRAKDTVDMQNNDVESAMQNENGDKMADAHTEAYDDSCNVSLHSVMQSNVPKPYQQGSPTHLNMPGSGIMQRQRYENQKRIDLKTQSSREVHTSASQANQDAPYWTSRENFEKVAPQGVQGDVDDCEMFKLWLSNCNRYNLDCDEMLQGIQSGRKTLSQIFQEQDELIRKVVADSKVKFSPSSSSSSSSSSVNSNMQGLTNPPRSNDSPQNKSGGDKEPTQVERLKKAVKAYGSTVIVFHIGISLISLGGFYALVSSGIDMVGLLQKIGVGEMLLQSRAVSGASTFVVAYAVHKVFAPVRIAITLTSTPFIVRYLRAVGFLKVPK